jgi:hypothetical protein
MGYRRRVPDDKMTACMANDHAIEHDEATLRAVDGDPF